MSINIEELISAKPRTGVIVIKNSKGSFNSLRLPDFIIREIAPKLKPFISDVCEDVVFVLNCWNKTKETTPDNQNIVLVRDNQKQVCTGYWHGDKSGWIIYGDEAYKSFGKVVEWREI